MVIMAAKKIFKRKKIHVPIYDVDLVVVVTDDIPAAYKREFGVQIDDLHAACLGYSGRKFGLFFEPKFKRRGIIAHEIFHLTHRILEKCTCNFDAGHHEPGAYLCEYLTEKVHAILE